MHSHLRLEAFSSQPTGAAYMCTCIWHRSSEVQGAEEGRNIPFVALDERNTQLRI